ncbi:hypothetical protein N7471_000548 [Penicillium samsonianum]|uniref:uncharacterized protein n=1 Tax=Penicillium samsonianum TaxID=1882272 RepID=UPI0025494DAA|nr:uncharacterized protein N7471_000548 [Penicillium samsonianum]KAJ6149349.1 hypothetical protein N7471_000548 [Penicillium samsonianum]
MSYSHRLGCETSWSLGRRKHFFSPTAAHEQPSTCSKARMGTVHVQNPKVFLVSPAKHILCKDTLYVPIKVE